MIKNILLVLCLLVFGGTSARAADLQAFFKVDYWIVCKNQKGEEVGHAGRENLPIGLNLDASNSEALIHKEKLAGIPLSLNVILSTFPFSESNQPTIYVHLWRWNESFTEGHAFASAYSPFIRDDMNGKFSFSGNVYDAKAGVRCEAALAARRVSIQ